MLDKLVYKNPLAKDHDGLHIERERTPYVGWWLGRHVCDYDVRARVKKRSDEANAESSQSSSHCSESV
jgi:hypothetical protein